MTCRLTLFGPPRLLDGRGRPVLVPAKTFALAAYLLLESGGGPVGRNSLRHFLWPDSDAKIAATNLRKFLLRVRERQERFGVELIRGERNHVELSPDATVDLAEFLRILARPECGDLAALCDLYRGDLLEGLELEEAESAEWLRLQRERMRDAFVSTVAGRLEPQPQDGADRMTVRIAARRLTEVDPYNECGHRVLMRSFAEDGETARVRDVYRSLDDRLRDDLGERPDQATTQLFESLLPGQAEPEAAGADAGYELRPYLRQEFVAVDETVDPATAARAGSPRITILPPLPVAGHDYLHHIVVSLIEDVTIGLCRFKSLSVVAPHTAWEISQTGKKVLFRTFGIDYALESQLQNRGGELWLAVRLVEAVGRQVLWTDQYPLNRAQETQHYHRLSVQILTTVVDRVERIEIARYEVEQNPTAYHYFLSGQQFLKVLDLPHTRRARRAFKAALSTCPDFVPALSGFARTLRLEWVLLARGDSDLLAEAERLAHRSIDIDPDDARGYRELGACNLYIGRFDESLRAFEDAEQRNPQFADLLVDSADALTHACEPEPALRKVGAAIELNPLCPDYYWWVAGGSNFHLHRYSEAIDCVSRMRDQTPAYRLLAASWARLGDREAAASYVRKVKEIHPDFRVSDWLSILPIRDPQYERDYEQGLREAGFD